MDQEDKIIFFDGTCGLCHGFIRFLINQNLKSYQYGSLDGVTAKSMIKDPRLNNIDSIILYQHGKFYSKSDAVIRIFYDLGGVYRFFRLTYIIPKVIRDFIYDTIAAKRHSFQSKNCSIDAHKKTSMFLP